ncbi:MAG: hypothetical protein M3478_09645 [Planctomycetota bacterium]|nr:hypothetical protein [Planctomycetota bacterium]
MLARSEPHALFCSGDACVAGRRSRHRCTKLDAARRPPRRHRHYTDLCPDGVAWTSADNGQYIVRLLSNRIADVTGALAASRTLGAFSVQVPAPIMSSSTFAVAADLGRERQRLAPNT